MANEFQLINALNIRTTNVILSKAVHSGAIAAMRSNEPIAYKSNIFVY